MFRRLRPLPLAVAVAAAALAAAGAAAAPLDSTPIGPLPRGPVAALQTHKGELVAVALPHRAGGRVWRIARALDQNVLAQVGEADVGSNVVLVFKATGAGSATVLFGLTRGETSKAYESRTFKISIR